MVAKEVGDDCFVIVDNGFDMLLYVRLVVEETVYDEFECVGHLAHCGDDYDEFFVGLFYYFAKVAYAVGIFD